MLIKLKEERKKTEKLREKVVRGFIKV